MTSANSKSHPVTCPHCHTVYSVTKNMQYKCPGCGATIHIDNDGKIKSTRPAK